MRGVSVAGLLLLAFALAGVAAASEPPQAEAGLDQEAVVNGTVYLDAGGSLDPDGEIVDYDWSIETPGGNTTAPDCPSCAQTHFVPLNQGTYAVTVTVRDADGVSMDDTMYVRVQTAASSSSSGSGGGGIGPISSPNYGQSSEANTGRSGYSSGDENVRAQYNYESGNMLIQGYKGGAITLGGVDADDYRDPSTGPANAWMTSGDVDRLMEQDYVETHNTDGKGKVIKVTDSEKAKQLKQTLEEGTEAKYSNSTLHYGAEQTASGTVEEIAGDESGDGVDTENDPSDDCGIGCNISGGDNPSSKDGSISWSSTDNSGSNDGGSDVGDYSNIDVGYGGGGGDSGGSSAGGSDGFDIGDVEVGYSGGGGDIGGNSAGGSASGSSGSSGGSSSGGSNTLSCIDNNSCNFSVF